MASRASIASVTVISTLVVLAWAGDDTSPRDRVKQLSAESPGVAEAEWGDHVHFLYCAAWAILLALWFTSFRKWEPFDKAASIRPWCQVAVGVLVVSAVLSNLRLLCVEADTDMGTGEVVTPPIL